MCVAITVGVSAGAVGLCALNMETTEYCKINKGQFIAFFQYKEEGIWQKRL